MITAILKSIGVPIERLEIVLGSSYQKSPEYVMDLYRMMTVVTERDAKKAGAEVVKQGQFEKEKRILNYHLMFISREPFC